MKMLVVTKGIHLNIFSLVKSLSIFTLRRDFLFWHISGNVVQQSPYDKYECKSIKGGLQGDVSTSRQMFLYATSVCLPPADHKKATCMLSLASHTGLVHESRAILRSVFLLETEALQKRLQLRMLKKNTFSSSTGLSLSSYYTGSSNTAKHPHLLVTVLLLC